LLQLGVHAPTAGTRDKCLSYGSQPCAVLQQPWLLLRSLIKQGSSKKVWPCPSGPSADAKQVQKRSCTRALAPLTSRGPYVILGEPEEAAMADSDTKSGKTFRFYDLIWSDPSRVGPGASGRSSRPRSAR
jgi:hypothetical protein